MTEDQANEIIYAINGVSRSLGNRDYVDGTVADQLAQVAIAISNVADALNKIADQMDENNGH